jgi:hypothetical protein
LYAAAAGNRPTNHAATPTDRQSTIDLAPLADVIRDQNHRIEELSSAAAFWQVRALQAEEQLKQLTAGPVAADQDDTQHQDTPPGVTELAQSDEREAQGIWGPGFATSWVSREGTG